MNVEISDWDLICELNRRIESGEIFRAKNGKLWPKICPRCGGQVKEYGVDLNFRPEESVAMGFDSWATITKELLDKEGAYLPTIPFGITGRLYHVRCENSASYFAPCPSTNWEWFHDLDDARQDFFNNKADCCNNKE